jgi:DNA-binding PadR family transcriptional regulator
MSLEPRTLYKLMIIYMLDKVNIPLTGTQISDFILMKEYTDFPHLQQALQELTSTGLISEQSIHNTTRYEITDDGAQTLGFFGKQIPAAIVADMDEYLDTNQFSMRCEVATSSNYIKSGNQDYLVHCEVRDGKDLVIGIDISVPDEDSARAITSNWTAKSTDIYASLLRSLTAEPESR